MKLQIVSGLSGSGKTIALHTLEDMGYYCIDNLPISLLISVADHLIGEPEAIFSKTAVGIDARSQPSQISTLPDMVEDIRRRGLDCKVLFLDTMAETLIKRFSETRRKHPLTNEQRSLPEAIRYERELLAPVIQAADLRIDTTHTNLHELRDMVRHRIGGEEGRVSILFESFGFKHGLPRDVDFVFDARCLPNPYWQEELRTFNGMEAPVADYLTSHSEVNGMLSDMIDFLTRWIPAFEADGRSYLTIAVGCTGGQHRSVFLVERLARHFAEAGLDVMSRHRELS
ncbi:MAG: RNase adapter RapZ [Candidatus Thiodiazotropha sp. (ex Ctena orbiculata)]|uniref:RNase adapter RapZ n=1 Tax=Candidatus Thiodiazotropha taylori TaxID=2792791 RepID=A0A944QR90_9GAMM|nr:RNase adapter RapZ [Candidatus Thiodiazotropha taylori]MBT2987513.1 RNase adapter RapZ [Candidatus Thiodiazotropha taylori]MBT2995231.1 RNase adapter RapZ [Candidatus Thiodiazotropha taylori]MBT2999850.1 RNase adapter RapZ [Candidatus Thiodiazotropha taylori]MBT3027860.1 RNase adapter RapZ [Candidatus Thiodiazotropha taylori]